MEPHEPLDQESLMRDKAVPPGTAKELRKLCPEALAAWQVGWKDNAAKRLLAEKEWERRMIKEAAFWQRISAWIGVVAAIVGAVLALLGAIIARMLGLA